MIIIINPVAVSLFYPSIPHACIVFAQCSGSIANKNPIPNDVVWQRYEEVEEDERVGDIVIHVRFSTTNQGLLTTNPIRVRQLRLSSARRSGGDDESTRGEHRVTPTRRFTLIRYSERWWFKRR